MMEYKGYLGHAEFDDEANIFHGEGINIRDVITFQGKSVDELRQAFEDSVEDYLAFCAERGEEPEQPFSGRFTIRLSPEQHRQVIMAAEEGKKGDSSVGSRGAHTGGELGFRAFRDLSQLSWSKPFPLRARHASLCGGTATGTDGDRAWP
jgi:predicted HicB family RNase H-like nuclease